MWPFTSRRILGNRWWAVAFVLFVCWQAVDVVGFGPENASGNVDDVAVATDVSGAPVSDAQMQQAAQLLNSM